MAAPRSTRAKVAITPDHILLGHCPRVQALAARLRELIRTTVPDATERAYPGWHGIGYRHPQCGYFCGIFPQEKSVRLLFEYGILLPDPASLLEGNGKQTHYVDIRRQQDNGCAQSSGSSKPRSHTGGVEHHLPGLLPFPDRSGG